MRRYLAGCLHINVVVVVKFATYVSGAIMSRKASVSSVGSNRQRRGSVVSFLEDGEDGGLVGDRPKGKHCIAPVPTSYPKTGVTFKVTVPGAGGEKIWPRMINKVGAAFD